MKLNPEAKQQLQTLFDKAVKGLHAQGYERAIKAGVCKYRSADGKRCAIGQLIDDTTAEMFGGESWRGIMLDGQHIPEELNILTVAIPWRDHKSIGSLLQDAHDAGETPKRMRGKLIEFANRFDLTFPEGC